MDDMSLSFDSPVNLPKRNRNDAMNVLHWLSKHVFSISNTDRNTDWWFNFFHVHQPDY